MPFTGGQIQSEAAARRRAVSQSNLQSMEERYQRHVVACTSHHPDAKYLKRLIDDLKRQLGR